MSDDLSGFSMIELFRMEAESHTATLSAGLVALEGAPATPAEIEPLMRAAHSLKGARALLASMRPCVSLTQWKMDSWRRKKGKSSFRRNILISCFRGVDLLIQIAQLGEPEVEAWQSENIAAIDLLVAELTAVQEGKVPNQRHQLRQLLRQLCRGRRPFTIPQVSIKAACPPPRL